MVKSQQTDVQLGFSGQSQNLGHLDCLCCGLFQILSNEQVEPRIWNDLFGLFNVSSLHSEHDWLLHTQSADTLDQTESNHVGSILISINYLAIPAKMFTKIDSTFGSWSMIFSAAITCSSVALPPTSKKLAGLPPWLEIKSIVAMARPAPLTMHPILPSNAI